MQAADRSAGKFAGDGTPAGRGRAVVPDDGVEEVFVVGLVKSVRAVFDTTLRWSSASSIR